MLFAIEFIRSTELAGVDPNDLSWTRCKQRYESLEEAEDEMFWLEQERGDYAHRVVTVREDY
jgi:hypothetical protein